jgi:hypothetical protein
MYARRSHVLATLAALATTTAITTITLWPGVSVAQECRVLEVDMTPSSDLQMVIWLEDEAGNFVDTLFITRLTGSYGLGNRPGMMTFNSAWRWPYGRRTTTFPVWAHRHGMEWPLVVFQNLDDENLSHPFGQSSNEEFYCRPLREGETMWDTQTCASQVYTDKGQLSPSEVSLYPPRADLTYDRGTDHDSVRMFDELNPFDVISRPTPPGNTPFRWTWSIPEDFPRGNYMIWVEVNKEFDQNQYYNYPEPVGIPWGDYGLPYRGQPSVVYQVPFTITEDMRIASTSAYAGYGDPDGIDGDLRPPDITITTGVDGSGGSRLKLASAAGDMYRVRVTARPADDKEPPGQADELQIVDTAATSLTASFVAPYDDSELEPVAGYEIRYVVGDDLTEENFFSARLAAVTLVPDEPGVVQVFTVDELQPRSHYTIGVRPYDECRNYGPLTVVAASTREREVGTVDWCVVATAAYGSLLEDDVEMLRRFRDRFLRTHLTGELLVESYYTFGPALARMIAPSETLRRAARAGLSPLVDTVRGLSEPALRSSAPAPPPGR